MRNAWKLFACFQTAGGTGGAGSGAGGGETEEQRKAREEADRKARDDAFAKMRIEAKEAKDAAAKEKERADALDAKLKEKEAVEEEARRKAAATGQPAMTAEEAATLRKEIASLKDEQAKSKAETESAKRKAVEKDRDSKVMAAIGSAGITGQREIDTAYAALVGSVKTNADGTFTATYKNEKGEEIEGPVDADFVKAKVPTGLFPAKAAGGSGGRKPNEAGGGKDEGVLKDYSQAEWNKMTPAQRRQVQRERMEKLGVQTQ